MNVFEKLNELQNLVIEEQPEEIRAKNDKRLLAAFDCETDPFKIGRIPRPFCWGIKIKLSDDEYEYHEFWGDNCTRDFIKFLSKCKYKLKMFAHNGGKFDFIYLIEKGIVCGEPTIISGRMVEAKILEGRHVIRDSYAMMPIPLGAYQKTDINYDKMEREVREENKKEILSYLYDDCDFLLDLVVKFIERFGDNLTVGTAAIKQLKQRHPFEKIDEETDAKLRPYYIGGRVQCFKDGEIKGDLSVYDINSMYPNVMRNRNHAVHVGSIFLNNISADNHRKYIDERGFVNGDKECCYFAHVKGKFTKGMGHFPIKTKSGLNFTELEGEYYVTHHELQMALKYDQFEIECFNELILCPNSINFAEYVDTFMRDKVSAKESGDKAGELFAKLMLNSAYGKFGQNPREFKDYIIFESWDDMTIEVMNNELIEEYEGDVVPDGYLWSISFSNDVYTIYEKKPDDYHSAFNDVFVAASVTGAARADLMEAIINAKNPVYCDTDSLICQALGEGVEVHPTKLGAWDCEAEGDCVYIYGKKVYALFKDGKPYTDAKGKEKTANKGVKMNADQIRQLVLGTAYTWQNIAPSFSIKGDNEKAPFICRTLEPKKFEQIILQ